MKILIIQHHNFLNTSGGTEKICCFLANLLSNKYEVEISTNQNIEGKPVFFLNDKVVVTNIFSNSISQVNLHPIFNYKGKNPVLWLSYKLKKKKAKNENSKLLKKYGGIDGLFKYNLLQRARAWNQKIQKSNPDLIITMSIASLLEITYQNTYTIPIINSVNGRPDYDYKDDLWYRSIAEMELLKKSYEHITGIQVLFSNYLSFLPNTFKGKSFVIPNPVSLINNNECVFNKNKEENNPLKIIHIASLNISCKQQHIAIDLFSKIHEKYPNWELHFYGEGNDYAILKNLIESKKLTTKVFLNGFISNPLEVLKSGSIFIFPSKYEGFPLALTEAMSVGLPVIGFETCSGVNELITNEVNGFLAKNEQDMLDKMQRLMSNSELRNQLGKNAYESMKIFDSKLVENLWLNQIDLILKNS